MRKLVTNYTFNKTTKQITFTDYASIVLEKILLITDATNSVTLYQANDPQKGGTVSTNVLTLAFDTTGSGFSNTDSLQIFYEDTAESVTVSSSALPSGAATAAKQDTGNTSLSSLDSKVPVKGQTTMSGSTPVTIASDQTAVPASQSGTWNITNVSGTVSLPTGAATETTLAQVRDAIKAQLDIASTVWTDNSGAYYVRRDIVDEGTGTISVAFVTPSGASATPGAGLRPLATADREVVTDFYDVKTSGTGYSVGDLLARAAIIDPNGSSPSASFIWLNLTAGTVIAAPDAADVERANEEIAARQAGTWNITNISGTVSLPTGAATESKQDSQITELQAIKGYVDGVETTLSSIDGKVATSAKQDSQITELQAIKGYVDGVETSLSSIDGKMNSLGQKTMTGSQPVTIASDQSAVPASQSGTWNITNVSGTVSLPTGAATEAKQDTGNSSLSSIDGKVPAKGQTTMSGSTPVTIASDQSAVPASQSGSWDIRNVTGTVSLPTGAATETTLAQVRDAIKAQLDIASTIWTDNSGAYYVRRDIVDEGTGSISVSFVTSSGTSATPGTGLRPLATADREIITDFYDVKTSGTGYSVGDLLARAAIIDPNGASPSASFIWLNLTTGAVISAPTAAHVERANEEVASRQSGTWNITNISGTVSLPTGAATEAKQDSQVTELQAIKGHVDGVEGSLTSIDGKMNSLGQKTMSGSQPVAIASDQSTIPVSEAFGVISTANSTTTPLNANATWTGTWEDISAYSSISIIGSTDQSGTLSAEFSTDGTNIDRSVTLSTGTTLGIHTLIAVAKYMRVKLVNSTVSQTTLRLQTLLNKNSKIAFPTSRMTQTLTDYSDVLNVRAAIVGKTSGGLYTNIGTDAEGDLDVHVTNPTTAFGEMNVAQDTPVAQVDFVYGINTNTAATAVTGSGTVTATGSLLTVNTTAAASSSAQLTSLRYAKYRPGQGIKARFTAIFTTGATGSQQFAGMGDPTISDGFFYGYDGATFGILYYRGGVKTFIAQSSWNFDVVDGTQSAGNPSGMLLDTAKGNVFQIHQQYLGFGSVSFYVENPASGNFTLVHELKYANANTQTNVVNPAMNLVWRAVNTTNNTAISVKAGSGALFVEGQQIFLGPRYATSNNKSLTANTLTNVLTLKAASTFNTVTNRAQIRMRMVSSAVNASNATGLAVMTIYKNATLGGTPSYTPSSGTTADNGATITNGQSMVSYDTAGTTVTGGIPVFNTIISASSDQATDLTNLDIYANPGDTLTFAISSTQTSTAGVAITWSEDI